MRKKIYLFFVLLIAVISVNAQDGCCDEANNLLTNGNFDAATCGGNFAFQNNCVPNWSATGGSPSLAGFGTNPNAWMWSYDKKGEAISGGMNFRRGITYNICFRIQTDDRNTGDPNVANNATVNLVATNNAGNVTATPNGQIIFQDTMGSYLNTWTTINVQFTPNADYAQLWVFPFMEQQTNGVSQAEMNIDDIVISMASETVPDFTMKREYCEDEPITPLTIPSDPMSYRWLIHEVNSGGNILRHATLGVSGNITFIDFRSLWNGYQIGKQYTVTLEYWDNCGNKHTLTREFTIIAREVHTSCVNLACGEPFDVNALNFPDLCGGEVISIEDLVNRVFYVTGTPIMLKESTVLKLTYECCELFLCVNVAKEEEVQIKDFCPNDKGILHMEACGGGDGYYNYIINGEEESSTESTRIVDYVPGGEYSVTFVSETGCKCTVIYRLNCDTKDPGTFEKSNTNENSLEKPSSFVIHPNPSDGNYSITSNLSNVSNEKTYKIRITDISGKSILKKDAIPLETTYNLNISKYTAGIYFLTIKVGAKTEVKKLIKK